MKDEVKQGTEGSARAGLVKEDRTHYSDYEYAAGNSFSGYAGEGDISIDGDNNWLISFSDLLSLLLVFFIMFLVVSKSTGTPDTPPRGEIKTRIIQPVELNPKIALVGKRIKDELSREMNSLNLGDEVSVVSTGREVIVAVKEKVTFSPGEAELLGSFEPVLDNIADIIRRYPSLQVDIVGHTDNVPIHTPRYPSNWELSVARAASVLRYLVQTRSLDPSRLSIRGNADQRPLVPNDTPEHRAQNRRVEIRLRHVEA